MEIKIENLKKIIECLLRDKNEEKEQVAIKSKEINENRKKIYEKIEELNFELQKIVQEKTRQEKIVNEIINKIKIYEKQINELEKEKQEKEQEVARIDKLIDKNLELQTIYQFWKVAFGKQGIRNMLIGIIIPYLEKTANEISEYITDGNIIFDFSDVTKTSKGEIREKLSFNIVNKYGGDKYEINSGGEKKRADICIVLALQKIMNVKYDFIFFDEVFDTLDEAGIEKVSEFLELFSKEKQVYIISHSNMENYFNLVTENLILVKENGITSLRVEK